MAEPFDPSGSQQHPEPPAFDRVVRAPVSIEVPHNMIHRGMAFGFFRETASLNDGASEDVLVQPGANNYVHLTLHAAGPGAALLTPYDAPTVDNAGTALDVRGFNRAKLSPDDSEVSAYHGPTLSDVGTKMPSVYIPGGEKKKAPGGGEAFTELILPPGSSGVVARVTNRSGAANPFFVSGFLYEVELSS
jgi:hypothetical protein